MNKTRHTVPVFQWRPQCHKLRDIAVQFFHYAFIYTVPVQSPGNNSATAVRQKEKWSCVVLKTCRVSGVSFQLYVNCPASMEGNASLQTFVGVDCHTLGHSVQRKEWSNFHHDKLHFFSCNYTEKSAAMGDLKINTVTWFQTAFCPHYIKYMLSHMKGRYCLL